MSATSWKRNQTHYQSQLEMLNPQRTLERGYAVILGKDNGESYAVRKPDELVVGQEYLIQIAEGNTSVELAKVTDLKQTTE